MICVSICEQSFERCKAVMEYAPMVELRGDLCRLQTGEVERLVSLHSNMIFTCRIAGTSLEFAREQIFAAIRRGVRYVDVEIEAPQDFIDLVKLYASENGTKLIISYHDYKETKSFDELVQIAELCRCKGADMVKVVTTAHDISDAVRVLSLYKYFGKAEGEGNRDAISPKSLIAFAMGREGRFSRFLSLHFGAPYTYASCSDNEATAPGQYTFKQMERLLAPGDYKIDFRLVHDSVSIPCSKSVAQRALLAAAFSQGESSLKNFEPCNDILGAMAVIEQFGCEVSHLPNNEISVKSKGAAAIAAEWRGTEINTGESGLLARLLIPFAACLSSVRVKSGSILCDTDIKIAGVGSVLGRNFSCTADAVTATGAECKTSNNGYLPFYIGGSVKENVITVSGSESSQTVSGLLMSLPLLKRNIELRVIDPASVPYIDLTLSVLKSFGVEIERLEESQTAERVIHTYRIAPSLLYKPARLYLEPDWSSAAFFAVAYAISSSLHGGKKYTLKRMHINTTQADEAILGVLESSDVKINFEQKDLTGQADVVISAPSQLTPFHFDATDAPDLFPILSLYATFCNGESSIKGVHRLVEKESNRAESIYTEYTLMGADIEIREDTMYIRKSLLHSANVHSHNDHRMAMSLMVASLFIEDNHKMRIDNLRCIDKSFPSFITKL